MSSSLDDDAVTFSLLKLFCRDTRRNNSRARSKGNGAVFRPFLFLTSIVPAFAGTA
jgi:hypothetical protein